MDHEKEMNMEKLLNELRDTNHHISSLRVQVLAGTEEIAASERKQEFLINEILTFFQNSIRR